MEREKERDIVLILSETRALPAVGIGIQMLRRHMRRIMIHQWQERKRGTQYLCFRFYSLHTHIHTMEDLEQLERLSLVNKVVSELYNHTGLSDKVLGM